MAGVNRKQDWAAMRRAVLAAIPAQATEFEALLDRVGRTSPGYTRTELRAAIWSLLSDGELLRDDSSRLQRRH